MTATTQTQTPRQIDEQLADLWRQIYAKQERLSMARGRVLSAAGAKYYYRGRQRVTDMPLAEAIEQVTARASYVAEYKATHAYVKRERYERPDGTVEEYDYHGTRWDDFQGAPYEADEPAEALAKLSEAEAGLRELEQAADALEDLYTGWSRFFLVTSSSGHIHSSMCCSTCRPTTQYGWLPQLSGQTEEQAVKDCGPTLCTVCFPSAPLDWTEGKKLTAAQAAKMAA